MKTTIQLLLAALVVIVPAIVRAQAEPPPAPPAAADETAVAAPGPALGAIVERGRRTLRHMINANLDIA